MAVNYKMSICISWCQITQLFWKDRSQELEGVILSGWKRCTWTRDCWMLPACQAPVTIQILYSFSVFHPFHCWVFHWNFELWAKLFSKTGSWWILSYPFFSQYTAVRSADVRWRVSKIKIKVASEDLPLPYLLIQTFQLNQFFFIPCWHQPYRPEWRQWFSSNMLLLNCSSFAVKNLYIIHTHNLHTSPLVLPWSVEK